MEDFRCSSSSRRVRPRRCEPPSDRISSRAVTTTLPATMRAVVIHKHGGPGVLTLESHWPTPTAGPGEILGRVEASALNFLDIFTRGGTPGGPPPQPPLTGGGRAGGGGLAGAPGAVHARARSWRPLRRR